MPDDSASNVRHGLLLLIIMIRISPY